MWRAEKMFKLHALLAQFSEQLLSFIGFTKSFLCCAQIEHIDDLHYRSNPSKTKSGWGGRITQFLNLISATLQYYLNRRNYTLYRQKM